METDSGQSSNRLFILLAAGMVGLICIGLVGLTAAMVFIFNSRAQEAAAVTPTFTPILPTPTPTSTVTPTPTETPLPTPTGTRVVSLPGEEPQEPGLALPTAPPNPEATPTNTRVIPITTTPQAGIPAGDTQMPSSGGILTGQRGYLVWWAGAVLLFLLGGAGYFWRTSASR
ncbi:MAG: hypothetical protein D6784_04400 [Chloroflexi bacterium]|nr:MAG: hypothetical protein D6784_04400 [Chloroflexota bacterium]